MFVQILVIFLFVGSLSGFNAVAFWLFASLALTREPEEIKETGEWG
jgi:putative inorganic carbon (hco3(-)) transporter